MRDFYMKQDQKFLNVSMTDWLNINSMYIQCFAMYPLFALMVTYWLPNPRSKDTIASNNILWLFHVFEVRTKIEEPHFKCRDPGLTLRIRF